MSDTSAPYPLYPENPRLSVVTLHGASSLNEDQILDNVRAACDKLKPYYDAGMHTSRVVFCVGPITAAVVEKGEDITMFIGLGLEVIQAMQYFEKK